MNYQQHYYFLGCDISLKDRKNWVAIIGSRKPTPEEKETARKYAKQCVKEGKVVVSGLAEGIDAYGHIGAIENNGITIAIVNTPSFQPIYPKSNRLLANQIIDTGGIIFPFPTLAQETEKGLSQFSKRLIERDILLAHFCTEIAVIKNSDDPIEGGTRWGVNYGIQLGKYVYRVDNDLVIHQDINYLKSKIWWEPELAIIQGII